MCKNHGDKTNQSANNSLGRTCFLSAFNGLESWKIEYFIQKLTIKFHHVQFNEKKITLSLIPFFPVQILLSCFHDIPMLSYASIDKFQNQNANLPTSFIQYNGKGVFLIYPTFIWWMRVTINRQAIVFPQQWSSGWQV